LPCERDGPLDGGRLGLVVAFGEALFEAASDSAERVELVGEFEAAEPDAGAQLAVALGEVCPVGGAQLVDGLVAGGGRWVRRVLARWAR
jgi:hypothetical protein